MLKHNEVNPLAVFGLRQLEHCPPHFQRVDFDLKTSEKAIADWIWANLEGRFWVGDWYSKDPVNNTVQMCKRAGFEIAGEASMFALMLDQINNNDIW
jgi:hypothetical protein